MYAKSKYVVGVPRGGNSSALQAVVIPETMGHNDLYMVFVEGSITSAGYCHYGDDKVHVYGESVGLKKDSRPDDEILVGQAMSHPTYAR
jgi:hypothetical protein